MLGKEVSSESENNIEQESMKDAKKYFEQTDITYNGHPLTAQDRQRVLDMLKVMFPEYQQPPVQTERQTNEQN
jgi:hypothetical protein